MILQSERPIFQIEAAEELGPGEWGESHFFDLEGNLEIPTEWIQRMITHTAEVFDKLKKRTEIARKVTSYNEAQIEVCLDYLFAELGRRVP